MPDKPPPLPRIPTPFSGIWREIRLRVIPPLVFLGIIAACYFIWAHIGTTSGIPGVGEGTRSIVASPYVGIINQLYVEPFQWVEQGQPIAQVAPVDPQSRLDLLQSELQIARMRLEPSFSDQNAMSYERIRVEWLRLKQELAMAKVNFEHASNLLQRNEKLVKENLVSQDVYELSLQQRNVYQSQIETTSSALKEIEERMTQLRSLGEPESPGTNQPLVEMIARLEKRLTSVETNWAPMILYAPMSGMVQSVYRRAAEYVVEGEPLVIINSSRSERVIAYLRQPYFVEPEIGMEAEIVTRDRKRQRFISRISEIGAQVEIITNSLAFIRQGAMVDEGLPVVFPVPTGAHIRPGEIVDVVLKPLSLLPKDAGQTAQTIPGLPIAPPVR
jgi:multidrug resistance efflux pump